MKTKKQMTGGRKPKAEPVEFRYSVNFSAKENAEFLTRFEQSGVKVKAQFIAACIFEKQLKVAKYDVAAMEYYTRLTNFFAQFRAVGVNYNQITKAIKANFSEKKALALLYKLENATRDLIKIQHDIIALSEEFETKYLKKIEDF
jgi:hypothetical protein